MDSAKLLELEPLMSDSCQQRGSMIKKKSNDMELMAALPWNLYM